MLNIYKSVLFFLAIIVSYLFFLESPWANPRIYINKMHDQIIGEMNVPSSSIGGQNNLYDHKNCDSCIVGSASFTEENKVSSNVYYLYGAEHLNLSNYYFDFNLYKFNNLYYF